MASAGLLPNKELDAKFEESVMATIDLLKSDLESPKRDKLDSLAHSAHVAALGGGKARAAQI